MTEQFVDDRQAAAGRRAAAEGAAGLQDRQHARRRRRLRRRDAPRDRRPARGLELHRRPDPGLGRHRHRPLRVPDPHRPALQVKAEDLEPLPNLAKSWDWSEDGKELTMHLIEGAKWSDGDPFDADDVMFYWDDHVLDPNVTPLNGASPGDLRRRHDARQGRRLHGEVDLHRRLPRARCSTRSPTAPSARARATS